MRVTTYNTRLTENRQITLIKEDCSNYPGIANKFNQSDLVAQFATEYLEMDKLTEEYMYMMCLNSKLALTSVFRISHGNVNTTITSPREIFQKALLANAVYIILMHNHPSGDPTPSDSDLRTTKNLADIGELLDVILLDHIIIASNGYYSTFDHEKAESRK
nr:JAB domain-containing protein [uncultured Mediterraneibacter sp.]